MVPVRLLNGIHDQVHDIGSSIFFLTASSRIVVEPATRILLWIITTDHIRGFLLAIGLSIMMCLWLQVVISGAFGHFTVMVARPQEGARVVAFECIGVRQVFCRYVCSFSLLRRLAELASFWWTSFCFLLLLFLVAFIFVIILIHLQDLGSFSDGVVRNLWRQPVLHLIQRARTAFRCVFSPRSDIFRVFLWLFGLKVLNNVEFYFGLWTRLGVSYRVQIIGLLESSVRSLVLGHLMLWTLVIGTSSWPRMWDGGRLDRMLSDVFSIDLHAFLIWFMLRALLQYRRWWCILKCLVQGRILMELQVTGLLKGPLGEVCRQSAG